MDPDNSQAQQNVQPPKVKYICEGTCGGSVTEEEYNAGKTTCATTGCTHFGKPFRKIETVQN